MTNPTQSEIDEAVKHLKAHERHERDCGSQLDDSIEVLAAFARSETARRVEAEKERDGWKLTHSKAIAAQAQEIKALQAEIKRGEEPGGHLCGYARAFHAQSNDIMAKDRLLAEQAAVIEADANMGEKAPIELKRIADALEKKRCQ